MESIENNKYTKENISQILGEDLKSHYIKRENAGIISVGEVNEYKEKRVENVEDDTFSKIIEKCKIKFALKLVGALSVVAIYFGYNYFPDNIKNNIVCSWIKDEYNNNYSKEEVIENAEEISKKVYIKIENIIPEKVYTSFVSKYINNIKPKIMNFDISNLFENKSIDNTVAVFNEDDIVLNNDDLTLAEEAVTTSSETSLMNMDLEEILSKNINIALPVNGTVTSDYGARDEVFENVGYHTGVDIANVLNTPVASATDGTVVLAQSMDKYYGNNIEIEKDGNVNEGDIISQGDIIGLMGSTGASTGSHLHFEIKINGRSVDPELLLKIR
jgi:murein DD-endopeptidase MepM/ murein hydrolase activator NlpD